jgi:sensor c-di-GMP phosphodiesterase-like protein
VRLLRREIASILIGGVVAAVVAFASIAAVRYWQLQQHEERELAVISNQALTKAKSVLDELDSGFKRLANLPTYGCDDRTLDVLRDSVKSTVYLKSAGIELGQNIYCTDLGMIFREKPLPDYRTSDGTMAWLYRNNLYSRVNNTLYMQRRSIILGTLHTYFLNVISDSDARLILLSTDQQQIMARHPRTADLAPALMSRLRGADGKRIINEAMYFVRTDKVHNVTVIAYRPHERFAGVLHGDVAIWFPLSLLCGLLAGTLLYQHFAFQHTPEQSLKRAVAAKVLDVHYQPIVSLKDGRCIGAECLLRWRNEAGEDVPPDVFVPMAERMDLIEPLTDIILEKAILELSDLLRDDRLYLSINLSASDMAKRRFFPILRDSLQRAGLAPGRIAIEATERGFVDADNANQVLSAMREAGHAIFIDDFGTGYSSLSYLQKLAIDVLKIDKSFVEAIGTQSATSSVIIHIIGMAKQLHLKIVAEGVETQAQADFLRQHGVDAGQGWLFSKPLTGAEFRKYLLANTAFPLGSHDAH